MMKYIVINGKPQLVLSMMYLPYCCDCILRSTNVFLHVLFGVAFFHCIFQHVIASNCRQYDEIILLSSFDILSVVSVSLPSLDSPFLRRIHSSDVWQLLGLVWHEVHLKDTGVFLQAPNVVSKTGSLVNTFMFTTSQQETMLQ